MKRNGIVLLMSALMLLSAAVYITGCNQPANNSTQNQGNQGAQSGIEGVWELKKNGSITYPIKENGVEMYFYWYFKNGKLTGALKAGGRLEKSDVASYTLSGNTITVTSADGQTETVTYSISGNVLKLTSNNGSIMEWSRVTSPTAQEIESAPQG